LAYTDLRRTVLVLTILLSGISHYLHACNVPAFRYALEKWPADPYQVLVYYQTPPRGAEFELLQKGAAERDGVANYSLKRVDAATPEGKVLAEQRKIAAYPWIEIFYPAQSQIRGLVWSGPLTSPQVKRILASPQRSGLVQRLLSGEVAVWVLVKSGHEAKDQQALHSLTTHLRRASSTLRIPEIGTDLDGNPVEVTDFKTYPVHFGLLEIARDDPDEELLVSALLKSEPDLEQYDEPMAFPVFGRGRALYALVGHGIQEKTILEACESLINWCSCEIKALNPGTDLLISADWSRPFGGKMVQDPDLPLTGLTGFVEAAMSIGESGRKAEPLKPGPAACEAGPVDTTEAGPVPVTAPVTASTPASDSPPPLLRNLLYLAGGAGLLVLTLSALVTVKRKNRQ
jgi:hypothetical protein